MNFSTNQNRQVYVFKSKADALAAFKGIKPTLTKKGVAESFKDNTEFWVKYESAAGEKYRSDIVKACHVTSVSYAPADELVIKAPIVEVTIPDNLVFGADYTVKVAVKQGISLFGEKHNYCYATYKVVGEESASDVAEALAKNFMKNLRNEPELPFEVKNNGAKLVFTGKLRSWRLGLGWARATDFDVFTLPVRQNGVDVIWAQIDTENKEAGTLGITKKFEKVAENSKMCADLEYFALGERGDQYRMFAYPNNIESDLRVDPNAEKGYDVLTIHYVDEHGTSFKSEKEMQILIKAE